MFDLTKHLDENTPRFPGSPRIHFEDGVDIVRDGLQGCIMHASLHAGTHLDAPAHFPGGDMRMVCELPLGLLCGTGVVIEIPDKGDFGVITAADLNDATPGILPGDRVIIKTGWNKYCVPGPTYDIERYMLRYPGLDSGAVDWLVERGVTWVGTDTPSPDHPFALSRLIAKFRSDVLTPDMVAEINRDLFPPENAHRTLLANGIPMVEQLGCEVDELPIGRMDVWALPTKVACDASQVRVVAAPTK